MDANSMTSLNHIRDELKGLSTSLANQPDSMSLELVKAIKEKFIDLNHALNLPVDINTLEENDIKKLNEICSKLKKKVLKIENIFRRHINKGIVTEQDLEPIVKASEILKNLAQTLKMHKLTRGSVSFESTSIQPLKAKDRLPNQNYEQALKEFKNHINDLANPLLVKDILRTIQGIQVIDPHEGIADNFSKLNLPKETDSYLKGLNEQMVAHVCSNPDQIGKIIEAVGKDLEEFVQEMSQQETLALWEPLEIFYGLPAIKKLKNEDVKEIVQGINRGNIAQLRTCLHRILKDNGIEESEINKQITDCKSKSSYENISTLIGQVIKQKPKKQEGIISYWNNDPTFFMNKTLSLKDPKSHESYGGNIVNCYRDKHHTLVFILSQGTEVHISQNYRVFILEKKRYKWGHAIFNQFIPIREIFSLETSIGMLTQPTIQSDDYLIDKCEEHASLLFGKYIEIELLNGRTRKKAYILHIYKDKEIIDIYKVDPDRRDLSRIGQCLYREFNAMYSAIRTVKKEIMGINQGNADTNIQVKDERDENKIRLLHLDQIKKTVDKLRETLLQPENGEFLGQLIDNLVKNHLKSVDLSMVASGRRDRFLERLKDISNDYKTKLNNSYQPADILKKIVEEANYARLINKEQNLLVSKTMELLQEAFQHVDRMKGKDLIFFIGNTGAGKSTAISYFLGAEMEVFVSRVGDNVVRVKKNTTKYPTIGQSLGESETLYTQGYSLKDSSIILADSPGLNDTRGGDYVLCTNLSMDHAMLVATQILSVVVVVPMQAFTSERGNHIIELMEIIRERFPNTFNNSPEDSSNIFLLVTKQAQVSEEVVEHLNLRLQELYRETQEKINGLLEQRKNGFEIEFELNAVRRRDRIWGTLVKMWDDGKINFIDVEDISERKQLLDKYAKKQRPSTKLEYIPAMQGREMQQKFGQCIEMSTDTWTNHIFKQYLEVLPKFIQTSETHIKEKTQHIVQLKSQKEGKQTLLKQCQKHQKRLEGVIKELEQAQRGPASLTLELKNELQQQISHTKDQEFIQLEKYLSDVEGQINEQMNSLENITEAISNLSCAKKFNERLVEEAQKEIKTLETGFTVEHLWKFEAYNPDDILTIQIYKNPNARDEAFARICEEDDDAFEEQLGEVRAGNYRGTLLHIAIIEKDFQLVPKDQEARSVFEKLGEGGKYKAIVEGENYEIDLGRKSREDGKKMAYGFKTIWDGKVMPWIKISHQIPNVDRHAATICNRSGAISLCRREIELVTDQLEGFMFINGKNQERREIREELKRLEKDRTDKEIQKKQLEKDIAQAKLEEMLGVQRKGLTFQQKTEEMIKQSIGKIETRIKNTQIEIEALEKKVNGWLKTKRNLAIIIHTQLKTMERLREFSSLVIRLEEQREKKGDELEGKKQNEMVIACREFIKIYNENIEKLKEECRKDLALAQ